MLMRYPILFFMLASMLTGCGMTKYGISEAWVFTEEKFRGNIQVDNDDGIPAAKGVMIETNIFLETTTSEQPEWTSAEINGKQYKIKEATLVKSPFDVGKKKTDETPVTISTTAGNYLYRLSVEAFDPEETNSEISNIRLSGVKNGNEITLRIRKKATSLLPEMVP
jgi:hypothetical protein